MNKLFSKIAALTLGLGLAVGVGVAAGRGAQRVEATAVSFTPASSGGWTASAGAQSGTKDGVTLACTNGIYNTQLRFYSGSTVTVSSTVGSITKVEFTCTGSGSQSNGPGNLSGTGYTYSGTVGTWAGSADSVTLNATAQVRCTEIAVTYSGRTLNSVEVSGTLTKSAYYVGETFDPAGLTFTAKWSDGDVTLDATEIAKIEWAELKDGDTSVKGTYEEVEFTVNGITVSKDELSAIVVSGTLTKSAYNVGDNWSEAGLVATGTYTHLGEKDITNLVAWSYDPEKATSTSVTSVKFTATYDGKSGYLNCAVTVTEFNGYVRVDNLSDLHYGDEVLLGVHGQAILMGASSDDKMDDVSTLNMMEEFSKVSAVDLEAGVKKFVVTYGTTENTFAFADADGYLTAAFNNKGLSISSYYSLGNDFVPTIESNVMHIRHVSYKVDQETAEIKYNSASGGMFRMYKVSNDMASVDIYRKAGSADLEAARTFASSKMKMDQYVGDETYDKTRCEANYAEAKSAYSALSVAAKNLFNFDDEFKDAKARLTAWAEANGEVLDSDDLSFTKVLINNGIQQAQPGVVIIVIMASLVATSFGVVALLKTRKKEK